tara:strand:+ start:1297 stop:1521 length:225 start_codon:yes stop_codon:yes gene_type:complete
MRTISSIATQIQSDWKAVNYAAKPYLAAMHELENMQDNYYQDDAQSVVRYFLANAGTWRGDVAKLVKAELKGML